MPIPPIQGAQKPKKNGAEATRLHRAIKQTSRVDQYHGRKPRRNVVKQTAYDETSRASRSQGELEEETGTIDQDVWVHDSSLRTIHAYRSNGIDPSKPNDA